MCTLLIGGEKGEDIEVVTAQVRLRHLTLRPGEGQSMGVAVELDLTEKVLSACSGSILTSLLGTQSFFLYIPF